MKRSQASSPSPSRKKLKVDEGHAVGEDAGEWTKVEKRKGKKVKKAEANLEVCCPSRSFENVLNDMSEKPASVYVCEWRDCETQGSCPDRCAYLIKSNFDKSLIRCTGHTRAGSPSDW
jgi:hypothetical protein